MLLQDPAAAAACALPPAKTAPGPDPASRSSSRSSSNGSTRKPRKHTHRQESSGREEDSSLRVGEVDMYMYHDSREAGNT